MSPPSLYVHTQFKFNELVAMHQAFNERKIQEVELYPNPHKLHYVLKEH